MTDGNLGVALLGLAAYWLALGWTGARVARWLLGELPRSGRLTAGFAITLGLQLMFLFGLGHFGQLSARHAMLTAIVMLLASRLLPVPRPPVRSRSRRAAVAWHAAGAHTALIVTSIVLAISIGEATQDARYLPPGANNYDDNYYHLPAAAEWFQHGDLRMLEIGYGDPSPAFYPIASELVAWSHLALLGGDDFTARFVELPFAVGCLIAIVATARALGVGTYGAVAAALLFAAIPGFSLHMLSAGNDLAMTFFSLVAVHALLLFAKRPGKRRAAYVGCAFGLFFGTKYTALVFAPALVLLACVAWAHPRVRRTISVQAGRRPAIAGLLVLGSVAAATAAFTGGYTYLRNAVTVGNPIYPAQLSVAGRVVLPGMRSHSPGALYRRREAASAPVELLWGRNDLFGPLFRWTLLPASLASPAVALLVTPGRRRRRSSASGTDEDRGDHTPETARRSAPGWDRLLTTAIVALPAVFYLGFVYLVADQRGVRYLYPALALAAVAFSWLVERLPAGVQSAVMLAVAAAAAPVIVQQFGHQSSLGAAVAVPLAAATIRLVPRLGRRVTRGRGESESPFSARSVDPLRERVIRSPRGTYGKGVLALATLALAFGTCLALAQTAAQYGVRRLDPNGAFAFLDGLTISDPATIAYAGGNQSYLLFGSRLGNEVLYVPKYNAEKAIYYNWKSPLVTRRGPPGRQAWYRNLLAHDVRYLVAMTVSDTPPEIPWVEQLPCCHELIWRDSSMRIYSLSSRELAAHLGIESDAHRRVRPRLAP